MTAVPCLARAVDLAGRFLTMLRQRRGEDFDNWLFDATTSSFEPFRSFAKSLSHDYSAVKAGLTLDISNGPVEGLNNRLKMLKRQMYGRAGLDLLSKRFILAP
ncbi:MAG: ISL3 family transposase ISAcma23 (plasmid) [Chroococcopsis gigantea SAG 12.99]|jgi:transposase|nr:ISL3 family transposase ISAcma23 [Chroococcopsis gigantea SAG 12.99]